MKATRKLIPALAMLLVAAVVMTSASYAWFTMSKNVEATDMSLTVTAPTNLLISTTYSKTLTNYAVSNPATLLSNEDKTAKLFPMTSWDGATLKTTSLNTSDGFSNANTTYVDATNDYTTDTCYYKDYVMYLATTGNKDVTVALDALGDKTTITGTGSAYKCTSLAVIYQGIVGAAVTDPAAEDGTAYTEQGEEGQRLTAVSTKNVVRAADCWTEDNVADADNDTDIKANGAIKGDEMTDPYKGTADSTNLADGSTGIITVEANPNADGTISSVTAVVVRVWFEGQSDWCFSGAAAQSAAINIGFTAVSEVAHA